MGENMIQRPSHYTSGRKYEPKDVIRDWDLNFNLGSAVKYISRAGRKGDKIEDLKKAETFLRFEIEALELEKVDSHCITIKDDSVELMIGPEEAKRLMRAFAKANPKPNLIPCGSLMMSEPFGPFYGDCTWCQNYHEVGLGETRRGNCSIYGDIVCGAGYTCDYFHDPEDDGDSGNGQEQQVD